MSFTITSRDLAFNADQSRWYDTDIAILVVAVAGVGVVSGCAVTAQGSPDMTVAIASGTIKIADGSIVSVSSGNGTIGTADGSNPRIDLVSASNAGTKTVTAGTAASSPKPPDLPAGHVALAMVYVPATDTTIATNQITDKRMFVTTTSRLSQSYAGYNTVGASFFNTDGSYAKQIVLAAPAVIATIDAHIKGNSSNAASIFPYILDDNSGVPGKVIATGTNSDFDSPPLLAYNAFLGTTARWVALPMGLYVPAGTYWIVVSAGHANGGTQLAFDSGGSDYTSTAFYASDGGVTATFSGGSNRYSIRASLLAA